MRSQRLIVLPGRFAVCRLDGDAPPPAWLDALPPGVFRSVTRTADELSVVCDERVVPVETTAARGWACLRVSGTLDFGEVGILADLTAALAGARVSVFAVSTFDTDYLLVRAPDLDAAVHALEAAGHEIDFSG
ncbi:MAG: ACT domain-containing protein [Planctomycetes bacterium]|nr:ACT domain-containing protein [Planctomycetota bacterium]